MMKREFANAKTKKEYNLPEKPLRVFWQEKYMIEFIKKYRSAPERTVITFKCSKRMCINKLGELERAGHNVVLACSDDSCDKKRGKRGERREEKDVEKEAVGATSAASGDREKRCECGCNDSLGMCLKGGVTSEKSARILLCDLVAGVVAMGVLTYLGKMLKGMMK